MGSRGFQRGGSPRPGLRNFHGTQTIGGSAEESGLRKGPSAVESHPMDPPPPLDYASPRMPAESRLVFTPYPDGGKLERAPATMPELLREALMPTIIILPLAAVLIWTALRINTMWHVPAERPAAMIFCGAWILGLAALLYTTLDALQNAGIILDVEVRGPWLAWTKQNLWGVSRGHWHTEEVQRVWVRELGHDRMLKVSRRARLPLGAFSNFSQPELESAAALLSLAIDRARDAARESRAA